MTEHHMIPSPDQPLRVITKTCAAMDLIVNGGELPDPYIDGQLILSETRQTGGMTIERADPRILIADRFLSDLQRRQGEPLFGCSVERPITLPPFTFGAGWLFRVTGINQSVLYRIGNHRDFARCWEAAWPD